MTDISKDVVKRFKLVRSDPGYSNQMCVRPDGNYVRHADYAALRDELDRAEARVAELERVSIRTAASLAAAISLLERSGKAAKIAAPSDKMFDQMLTDYRKSLDAARAALADEWKEGE